MPGIISGSTDKGHGSPSRHHCAANGHEGGFFLQPDVADAKILRDAQEHPENYQTLSVRVSGWNARFVTLCREWQDMVIGQNEGV